MQSAEAQHFCAPDQSASSTADGVAPGEKTDHLHKHLHPPEDALDLQTCTIRVRCSNCGMALYVSAPKVAANALIDSGLPPLLAIMHANRGSSRETLVAEEDNMKRCPNCQEPRLYDDGVVSETIDVVEMYNLRVSGSVPTLCVDCRKTMCEFSANFLAAIHMPPQSGEGFDFSGIDSIDQRKLAGVSPSNHQIELKVMFYSHVIHRLPWEHCVDH
jgi:hypothetical protein